MQEVFGDFWSYPADIKCITTNGIVNAKGLAVMGRGIALQAQSVVPDIRSLLGDILLSHGNVVWPITEVDGVSYIAFPVKDHWRYRASLYLIARSLIQLEAAVSALPEVPKVLLPRPGCGNGGLTWENVRPLCLHLPDNFVIIERSNAHN